MTKIDGRKLSHEELEKIRIAAVKRVLAGESPELVIKSVGFHRSCIYDWLSQYQKHGEEGLKAKPITGRPPKLTEEHLNQLVSVLQKKPTEFGIEKALWDRESFKLVIEQTFQVKISKTGVSRLLAKLGIYSKEDYDFSANDSLRERVAVIKMEAKKSREVLYFISNHPITNDIDNSPTAICLCAVTAKGDLRFILATQEQAELVGNQFTESLTLTVQKPVKLVELDELKQFSYVTGTDGATATDVNTDSVNNQDPMSTSFYSASHTQYL
ncbi:helix-turn-helix domain-containing protein [Spartinivicinus ruber]|uniref:helix-turn-helix domain-containing protein n=1 Tax=Spartinivicinus ruber TaxID=2683272 RepID=UPI0013D53726|nr:helix-turn-helix domain-containing protein [Spartinivicinus ruber]